VQRRTLISGLVLAGFAALTTPGCDDFEYERYVATLEGSQEAPSPTNSTVTGRSVLLVNRDGSRVDVTLTLDSNPATPIRFAHIHRAPRGVAGPIIHNLWVPPPGGTDTVPFDAANPIGRTLTFSAQDLADLRAGNLYANVHSVQFGPGEVRGQFVRQ
jgi:hypothetical protein